MRVTRETLIRIAKETAQERMYNNPDLIAAYLTGSLLTENPFLGGITDIDLVFVHTEVPAKRREIIRLHGDFHIDVTYRAREEYVPPRELRNHPWLGYEIYDPLLIKEKILFFDYVQAAVRAGFEFHEPIYILARCRNLLNHGRRIWLDLWEEEPAQIGPNEIARYLKSVHHILNSIAELSGPPLSERRVLLDFPARAEKIGRPGFSAGLLGLIGGNGVDQAALKSWLPVWQEAFLAAAQIPAVDKRIHSARLAYYLKAFEEILESDTPNAVLWPLLRTWTLSSQVLPTSETAAWKEACTQLALLGEDFDTRMEGLDHIIDDIEEILDKKSRENGVSSEGSFIP
ncbi:MAG: hypothetical protein JXA13_02990 [Anaerolineales bacterium]|nr:hypothetical protein [Anaerolineales bacterium]